MSCWVTPAVAADYWAVSIEHVHWLIGQGRCQTRTEGHFLLVDVIPNSNRVGPARKRPHERPPTSRVVSIQELQALAVEPEATSQAEDEDQSRGPEVSQWRTVRQQVARTRRPAVAAAIESLSH